jgi:hypothetical protein
LCVVKDKVLLIKKCEKKKCLLKFEIKPKETLRSAPPSTLSEIFPAHVSAESPSNIYPSPQPLRSHIQSFGTIGQLLKFSKKIKTTPSSREQGGGGVVNISSVFGENKPPVKFQNSN